MNSLIRENRQMNARGGGKAGNAFKMKQVGVVRKDTKGLLMGFNDDGGGAPFDKQFGGGIAFFRSWFFSWFRFK